MWHMLTKVLLSTSLFMKGIGEQESVFIKPDLHHKHTHTHSMLQQLLTDKIYIHTPSNPPQSKVTIETLSLFTLSLISAFLSLHLPGRQTNTKVYKKKQFTHKLGCYFQLTIKMSQLSEVNVKVHKQLITIRCMLMTKLISSQIDR